MKTDTTPYKFSMSYVMEDHAAAQRWRPEAAETEVDRPKLCLARQADNSDAWGPGQDTRDAGCRSHRPYQFRGWE